MNDNTQKRKIQFNFLYRVDFVVKNDWIILFVTRRTLRIFFLEALISYCVFY